MRKFWSFCWDKKPFFKELDRFLEQGFEEVQLIAEVQRYFFQLFLFSSHIRIYWQCFIRRDFGIQTSSHNFRKKREKSHTKLTLKKDSKKFLCIEQMA
ncbi:hypothetical protein [Helicobacter pullorum]|uniref:hypothetical protein n=1 Tax=Helicobacter pullorum TaxID=35818 RepID=UPI001FCFD2A6|nr:hypothetical protein [Helicobacter pullorum]